MKLPRTTGKPLVYIIGEGELRAAQAFSDVRDALDFEMDVYLGAMWALPLGIKLNNVVIYNMEPLYDGCGVIEKLGYMETLKSCHVIDYSRSNVKYLKKYNINAFYMPYGYHEKLTRIKQAEKDIDILFVGSSYHQRRINMIKELGKSFNFIHAEDVYGEDLDDLVARAKVHLNMHHCEGQPLEVTRLNYLLANGCSVVSERGNDEAINNIYDPALTFSDYDNIPISCSSLIKQNDTYSLKRKQYLKKYCHHDCRAANLWAKEALCQQ